MQLRDRYNRFIADHEVAWELTMAALAAAFVAIGFAVDAEPSSMTGTLEAVDLGLTVLFVGEFVSRLAASRTRGQYLRGHWVDALALIPTARGFRLLRLLRLLRLVRAFAGVYRALAGIERMAHHRGLIALFVAWLGVAVICGTALYLAEADINPNIHSPVDALWWGIVTLTTVGYGDIFPITPEGRLAGAALMILGITLFAAITGTITSYLVSAQTDGDGDVPRAIRALTKLHRDGLVTDDEFAAKRAELIARM